MEAAAYPLEKGTFLDRDCVSAAAKELGASSWGQLLSAGLGKPNDRAKSYLLAFLEELQLCSEYKIRCLSLFNALCLTL